MYTIEGLQAELAALEAERLRIANAGFCLQHCWLVQVKPGGTARTNRQYWQVRSCQAIFDGKKLKHLKPEEVEDYKAAIARGKQLKQIDRQIKIQSQRLGQLKATQERLSISNEPSQGKKRRQTLTIPTASSQRQPESGPRAAGDVLTKLEQPDVRSEQLIAQSEQLRALLQQSRTRTQQLCTRTQQSRTRTQQLCTQSQQSRTQSQQSRTQSQVLVTATLRLKEHLTGMAKGSFLYLS